MSSERGGEITERMIGTCCGSTLSLVLISIKVGGAETHDDIRAVCSACVRQVYVRGLCLLSKIMLTDTNI